MSWILTYTGKHFNYADPNLDSITLIDIAHHLSQINRFGGATHWPYSVAQHSIGASYLVPAEFALEALMHDAHEAYVTDMMSPLKALLPDYKAYEKRIEEMVRLKFDLPLEISPEVKSADLVMLATEKVALLPADTCKWPCLEGIAPSDRVIIPMNSAEAERQFIERFHELTAGRYVTVDYEGFPIYQGPPAENILKAENATQSLTLRNITRALALPGKKSISAEVIDLFNALTAENKELRVLAGKN
ncbi:HD family hydrolase [Brenneria populi subsp. brevivirga]|uniref:HD family hydrolase n=1 Tax=Brenneria populi TaxID=1505588 RepID=UPI002E181545|nr:HD family hydrolase [Brenneria populi subsp. brevivirga]